jgi:hypothetical protein
MGFLSSPIIFGPPSDITPLSPPSSALFVGISPPPLLVDSDFQIVCYSSQPFLAKIATNGSMTGTLAAVDYNCF